MEQMEKYYRVYADFKNSIEKIDSHRYMKAAQELADTGKDTHIGKVYYRVVDLDWVEAVESTLVYIDKAIREQRRFIEVTEEVVPIEKARNITTESVRHLAQHTNLIARVDGDDVTPERILNIQREESFAIYENRFLYTLLQKLAYFVGLRYKALSDAPNDSFSKIKLHRQFQVFDEKVEYDLALAVETHTNTKVDLNADVTTLSGYERVLRIRTVLGDFMSTPLMRELTGCEPVRPPILHTNLMTKNPNFKKSLDLWNYIETYTKPGYQAAGNEFNGTLEDKYKQAIYDTVTLQQFAMELCANPDLEDQLKVDYEEEVRTEREQRERKEEERIKLYEQKAELAVLEERDALRVKIDDLGVEIDSLKKDIADLTVDNENKERKIERQSADIKHLEKENSDKEQKIATQQLELDRKDAELEQANSTIAQLKATLAEKESNIAELNSQLEQLNKTVEKLNADILALNAQIESLKSEIEAHKQTIAEDEAKISQGLAEIAELNKTIEAKNVEISELGGKVTELNSNIDSLNAEIAAKNKTIEERDADISAKSEQIAVLQNDVNAKAGEIDTLNKKVNAQSAEIDNNKAEIAKCNSSLEENAKAISELNTTVEETRNKFEADEKTIKEKDGIISQRENNIAELNNKIEKAEVSHKNDIEKLTADMNKKRESDIKKTHKADEAEYKKQITALNSSAKAQIAAAEEIAQAQAKAKILAVKDVVTLDNELTLDEFRSLIKEACSIKRSQKSGELAVYVDDFGPLSKDIAQKYGVKIINLESRNLDKFEKSIAPSDMLKTIAADIESGKDIAYIASSEKHTGAVSTMQMVSREADYDVSLLNGEALHASSLPYAVGLLLLKQSGLSNKDLFSLHLSSYTYIGADRSYIGTMVKDRFRRIRRVNDDAATAFKDTLGDCNKAFACVVYSGYDEKYISDFAQNIKTDCGFENIVTYNSADAAIAKISSKSISIYYFN